MKYVIVLLLLWNFFLTLMVFGNKSLVDTNLEIIVMHQDFNKSVHDGHWASIMDCIKVDHKLIGALGTYIKENH